MSPSLGILIAAALAASALVFGRAVRIEQYEVRNRGVNQSPATTLARAGLHSAKLLLKFGGVLYLLATFYAFYIFQRTCARDDWTRAAYERGALIEHVTEALRWPLHLEGDPPCGVSFPEPVEPGV